MFPRYYSHLHHRDRQLDLYRYLGILGHIGPDLLPPHTSFEFDTRLTSDPSYKTQADCLIVIYNVFCHCASHTSWYCTMPAVRNPNGQADIIDIRGDAVEFDLKADVETMIAGDPGARKLPTMLLYNEKGLQLFEEVLPAH